jgi:H+/Cl- antiporter ClcA
VLLGTVTLPLVLPALATSLIATAVAWITLPVAPTYVVPSYSVRGSQLVFAALAGPLAGLLAAGWVRLVTLAHRQRPAGRMRFAVPVLVLAVLGLVAIAYPELLGNGQDTVELAVTGGLSFGLVVALVILKPLVTAACLGSGVPGGLFTPTLAFGVLFGAGLGHLWGLLWPGAAAGSYALIGGGALLAAAMQGPVAAVVLTLELAHHTDSLMVPLLLAVVSATVVVRMLGAQSIYSARLNQDAVGAGPRDWGPELLG